MNLNIIGFIRKSLKHMLTQDKSCKSYKQEKEYFLFVLKCILIRSLTNVYFNFINFKLYNLHERIKFESIENSPLIKERHYNEMST